MVKLTASSIVALIFIDAEYNFKFFASVFCDFQQFMVNFLLNH